MQNSHAKQSAAKIEFQNMKYARDAGFDADKECLAGTRKEALDKIYDWVNSPKEDASRMFLLTGVAGSGKSSIAHSVAHHFQKLHRLGSSFCFCRDRIQDRHPSTLFSTICRDLAHMDPRRRVKLAKFLAENPTINSIQQQFNDLFLGTGEGLDHVGQSSSSSMRSMRVKTQPKGTN